MAGGKKKKERKKKKGHVCGCKSEDFKGNESAVSKV